MDKIEPTKQHQWLHQLIGEWSFEAECQMGPDTPPIKNKGREKVRSLGGLWTIGEGTIGMLDGTECQSIMTLGFDPRIDRFVGTFIASMMTHLWPYNGSLNESGNILTLDSEGPGFTPDGGLSKYQDIFEFISPDQRTLSSRFLDSDGRWNTFMNATYRRTAG